MEKISDYSYGKSQNQRKGGEGIGILKRNAHEREKKRGKDENAYEQIIVLWMCLLIK